MFGSSGMDLFGDLPSAKNSNTNKPNQEKKSGDDSTDNKKESKNDTSRQQSSQATTAYNTKKSKSLVSALGNAGTTMAFVPTALVRKRHRTTPAPSSSARKERTESLPFVVGKRDDDVVPTKNPNTTTTTTPSPSFPSEINQPSSSLPTTTPTTESEEIRNLHASVTDPYDPLLPNDYLAYRERKKNERKREELERNARETLRIQQMMRERIEEERKKVEATGDYKKIVETRMKHTMAAGGGGEDERGAGGGGMGRGRGRGRGMMNLPAWLMKKKMEEEEKDAVGASGGMTTVPSPAAPGQFENAPLPSVPPPVMIPPSSSSAGLRLVVLSNMVEPGDVDEDLECEVREECELRCGPVENIRVFDATREEREVRVFVLFRRKDHAVMAEKLFHGRSFGMRVISAKLRHESLFKS